MVLSVFEMCVLEMCVLDGVNTCSIVVSGVDLFTWAQCTGFTDGDGPGNLFLGQCTGDGDLMRIRFWVDCGCFFLGGEGEGRGSPG